MCKTASGFCGNTRTIVDTGENAEMCMEFLLLQFDGKRQVMRIAEADPQYVFNSKNCGNRNKLRQYPEMS